MHVLHLLASAQRRGAEIFAVELARALASHGVTGRVIALRAAGHGAALEAVDVIEGSLRPTGVARLRRLVREADVAVGHGSRALIAGTAATLWGSVPFVYRSIGDPSQWGAESHSRRIRVGVQLRRAAAVVALWPGAAVAIAELYGVSAGRIEVIPNAVDISRIEVADAASRSRARRGLGLPAGDDVGHVVAVVGSLSEEKRVDTAIRAGLAAQAVVLVAGDGPQRQDLAARWAGPTVRFLGSLADVVPVLHASDALVLTSRTEGMPGVIIEAGLAGLPQVVTGVGGVRSMVDDSTGRVVDAGASVASIADAISDVITNRDVLGMASRQRMLDRFAIGVVARPWTQLLDRVVSRTAGNTEGLAPGRA